MPVHDRHRINYAGLVGEVAGRAAGILDGGTDQPETMERRWII